MRLLYNKNLKQISRDLRKNMTREEIILWSKIRKNQFNARFLRQKIIGNYVADFYRHKANLIFKKSTDEVGRPWFPLADEVSFVIPTGALKYLCSAAK